MHANAEGYETLVTPLNVGEARNQAYAFALTPLPGRIDFDAKPVAAEVWVDGASIGTTPLKASTLQRANTRSPSAMRAICRRR